MKNDQYGQHAFFPRDLTPSLYKMVFFAKHSQHMKRRHRRMNYISLKVNIFYKYFFQKLSPVIFRNSRHFLDFYYMKCFLVCHQMSTRSHKNLKKWREFLIITGLSFLKSTYKKCSPLVQFKALNTGHNKKEWLHSKRHPQQNPIYIAIL